MVTAYHNSTVGTENDRANNRRELVKKNRRGRTNTTPSSPHLLAHEVLVGLRLLVLRGLHGPLVHPVDALLPFRAVTSSGLSMRRRNTVCPLGTTDIRHVLLLYCLLHKDTVLALYCTQALVAKERMVTSITTA